MIAKMFAYMSDNNMHMHGRVPTVLHYSYGELEERLARRRQLARDRRVELHKLRQS